jgi:hypothetical protein
MQSGLSLLCILFGRWFSAPEISLNAVCLWFFGYFEEIEPISVQFIAKRVESTDSTWFWGGWLCGGKRPASAGSLNGCSALDFGGFSISFADIGSFGFAIRHVPNHRAEWSDTLDINQLAVKG